MTASLLDGKLLATQLKYDIKIAVNTIIANQSRAPALAVILVGEDRPSQIYVRNKRKACEEVGVTSHAYNLSADTTENELIALIESLNADPNIDGILVQLPLPIDISEALIIETIHPKKDVDGFHPYNLGRLAQKNPLLRPCTPMGIMSLLQAHQIDVAGKYAVVVGASNIVGRPMALELLQAGATVTICHSLTTHLERHVKQADILVVATGIPDLINTDWLQPQQVVVDVGIHRLANGVLRGDVNFAEALKKVAWLTPVPGGVGPMTIVSLLQNTLTASRST